MTGISDDSQDSRRLKRFVIPLCMIFSMISGCHSGDRSDRVRRAVVSFGEDILELNEPQALALEQLVTDGVAAYKKVTPLNRELHREIRLVLETGKINEARMMQIIEEKKKLEVDLIRAELGKVSRWVAALDEKQRVEGLKYFDTFSDRSEILRFHLGDGQK